MPNPALYITDGTTEVQLLRGPFKLTDWRPARAPLKGGGTWRSSPFVDGRRLVAFRRDNIVDTFSLLVQGYTQDELIYVCQEADRLLTKAMQYWSTSWQDEPVYLVARGHGETNARYAHIHSYAFPNAANPYVTPFAEGSGLILAQEDLTVVIEHGTWLQFPPTGHACTLISAENDYDSATDMEVHVTASADDCYVDEGGAGTMDLVGVTLRFGHLAGNDENAGMRFQPSIPQGATITYAYVKFQADFADAVVVVNVAVSCEAVDDAAVFAAGAGGYANFMARVRTGAATAWSPGAWVADQFYTTPDFTASIQEVIDRPGWVAGNHLVVFVDENGSTAAGAERRASSWDHGADLEPVLFVGYTPARTYGRDSTDVCVRVESIHGYILKEDGDKILLELGPPDALLLEGMPYEVYVANKTNMANLTHIWQFDASTGAYVNLIDAIPPTTGLFPGAIAGLVGNGDIIYFGIDTTLDDSGPFCSLVFDIDTAATYIGTATLTWQYPDAAGWPTLLPTRDNTIMFQNTFVNSLHWNPPGDWDETTIVNGVTGYWVRCIVSGVDVPNPMTNPSQQNRRIYTITWPRYDLNQADIGGDVVALVRSTADNQASNMTDPDLPFNKMWLGLRSLDRGDDFVMHLNVADEQNPAGITCTTSDAGGFVVDDTTPTGLQSTDTVTNVNPLTITWSMDNTIMPEFWGTYHAFVRGLQHSGSSGDVVIQIITQSVFGAATTHLWSSAYVPFTTTTDWELVDMGRVSLPPIGIAHPTFDIFNLVVEVTDTVTGSNDVTLYDLILLPIDEWAGSFSNTETNAEVDEGLFLDVNSISDPKRLITAVNRVAATGNIFTAYQVIANDHALVQANATQRMYHLFADDKISYPCISCAVWLFTNQQYLNMRGNR